MHSAADIQQLLTHHGYSFQGLLQTVDAVIAEATQEHLEAAAKAAALDEEPADKAKPGHPEYDPEVVALRACLGAAFAVATVKACEPLAIRRPELPALFALLTAQGRHTTAREHADWTRANLPGLKGCLAGIATHSSRYADPGSSRHFNAPAERQSLPLLCSATVGSPVGPTYFGNSANLALARYLTAAFLLEGKLASLLTGLQEDAQWLADTGMAPDTLDELKAAVASAQASHLPERVPQVYWPTGDGYLLLSPLPSTAVLDELKSRLAVERLKEDMPGRRVPLRYIAIGGANPQNVGAFNAACGGSYPLLRADVPRTSSGVEQAFRRRLWSKHWISQVSGDLLERLAADNTIWGAGMREAWVQKHIALLEGESLAFVRQVRAALVAGALEPDEALLKRLSGFAPWEWLSSPTRENAQRVAGLVVGELVRRSRPIRANTVRQDEIRDALAEFLLEGVAA